MRIIGGSLKGRKFIPPAKNWPTRPTTDYAKEGLFNILQNRIDFKDTKMLDLFGGTGSHCYEFVSRGCTDATYVDKHGPAIAFVHRTLQDFGISDEVKVVKSDVFKFIEHCQESYDYIFAGPPYPLPTLDSVPEVIFSKNILIDEGLFVLEHNPNHDFSDFKHFSEARNYGTTIFSFFNWKR